MLLRDEIINRMNLLMEVMTNEDLAELHNNSFDNWQVKYKDNNEFEEVNKTMIKIPDTLQKVFDIVSIHLLNQVKRSMSTRPGSFGCTYRGKDGMKCAAGVLIPDDRYNPKMEGLFWETLVSRKLIEDKFTEEIGSLQIIHDTNGNDSLEYLKYQLIRFAAKNDLICNFEV